MNYGTGMIPWTLVLIRVLCVGSCTIFPILLFARDKVAQHIKLIDNTGSRVVFSFYGSGSPPSPAAGSCTVGSCEKDTAPVGGSTKASALAWMSPFSPCACASTEVATAAMSGGASAEGLASSNIRTSEASSKSFTHPMSPSSGKVNVHVQTKIRRRQPCHISVQTNALYSL